MLICICFAKGEKILSFFVKKKNPVHDVTVNRNLIDDYDSRPRNVGLVSRRYTIGSYLANRDPVGKGKLIITNEVRHTWEDGGSYFLRYSILRS